jgi:hypothetical protein
LRFWFWAARGFRLQFQIIEGLVAAAAVSAAAVSVVSAAAAAAILVAAATPSKYTFVDNADLFSFTLFPFY